MAYGLDAIGFANLVTRAAALDKDGDGKISPQEAKDDPTIANLLSGNTKTAEEIAKAQYLTLPDELKGSGNIKDRAKNIIADKNKPNSHEHNEQLVSSKQQKLDFAA